MLNSNPFQRETLGGQCSWLCERKVSELKPWVTGSGTSFGVSDLIPVLGLFLVTTHLISLLVWFFRPLDYSD